MWFAFGLLTLALVFSVSLVARSRARWKGAPRGSGDVPQHEYQEVFHKGRLARVRIGKAAPDALQFRVRRERWYDRLFKALGISVEMQLQDPQFDDALYLESDVEALGNLLMHDAKSRSAIISIFDQARTARFRYVRIRGSHGRVWIEFTPRDKNIEQHTSALARQLDVLATALERHRAMLAQHRDPFVRRAILVLSISTATAALGVFGLIRGGLGRTDILDAWQLFLACLVPGLLALGLFLALIVAFLGRSSRTHLVLVEAVLVGGMGFVVGLFALAREANIEFDRAPARTIEVTARAEHVISRGRRGRRNHHYYLHMRDWRAAQRIDSLRLEISSDQYQRLQNSNQVTLQVKPGWLGFDWVESIQPQ